MKTYDIKITDANRLRIILELDNIKADNFIEAAETCTKLCYDKIPAGYDYLAIVKDTAMNVLYAVEFGILLET